VQSGSSLAPNSFLAGNKLLGHASPRQQMRRRIQGIVDIEGAAVIAYTDGIALFKNVRGGNTGEDFDCRLFTVNDGRGCISYRSLTSGNGWACYATTEGLVATDKTGREIVISGSVFNASDSTGDLAYEIGLSAAATAANTDNQYFTCAVMGSKLYVSVRHSTAFPIVFTYDFSRGIEASGLEELLDPERRQTYIWSPPSVYNAAWVSATISAIGAMASIRFSDGRRDYVVYEGNQGGTGDGRFDRINTGTDDNGGTFTAYGVIAPVVASEFASVLPQRCEATHLTTAGSEGQTKLLFANNQTPSFNTSYTRTLRVDSSRTRYNKQVVPIDQAQRGKTDMFWIEWRDQATSASNKLWRVVLEYLESEDETARPNLN